MTIKAIHLYTNINNTIENINTLNTNIISNILHVRDTTSLYIDTYTIHSKDHIELTNQKVFESHNFNDLSKFLAELNYNQCKFVDDLNFTQYKLLEEAKFWLDWV